MNFERIYKTTRINQTEHSSALWSIYATLTSSGMVHIARGSDISAFLNVYCMVNPPLCPYDESDVAPNLLPEFHDD